MKDEIPDETLLKAISALDKAIESGPWDKSNFLKIIGKNLQELRQQFDNLPKVPEEFNSKELLTNINPTNGTREVFISLYSSNGDKLQSWLPILNNLTNFVYGRPVYAEEKDIEAAIKAKPNINNEAYVSVNIQNEDILELPDEKVTKDKLGKDLLTLKNRVISQELINKFVHVSGNYLYKSGSLIKI